MRLIAYSFPCSKANWWWYVKCQLTEARLAIHVKDVLDRFELTDGRLLENTTYNPSSQYWMTRGLPSIPEPSRIEWPALRNHIPCMAHGLQLPLGAFMSSLGVKSCTMSREAHERDQQFGENESIDNGKSQRRRKEGNAWINKVSAMQPGLAKIIETIRISRYFELPLTDIHIVENSCSIDYGNTWSLKEVHWLSRAKVRIVALPIMDVKTHWNLTLELLEWAYRLQEFTCEWLQNPKYSDYRPLFTSQDEWTIVKYVMEVLRPLRYWTHSMSKRHTVTLHHVITVCNDMFNHMDGVMWALAKKET